MRRIIICFFLLVAIVITLTGCFNKKVSTNYLQITKDDEKTIYEYLDTKTNDIQPSLGKGKMYSAFKIFGTEKDKIYIWFFKKEYSKNDNGVKDEGGGVSCPLVLNVKKAEKGISIISHDQPVDGEGYGRSLKKLFPSDILEKVREYDYSGTNELEKIIKSRAENDSNE